jgi:hypothetical protein
MITAVSELSSSHNQRGIVRGLESSVIQGRKAGMSLHNKRRLRAPGDNFVECLMSDDLTENSMMHVSEPAFDI